MNREIKFRAWDGKELVYFRFRDLTRIDKGLFAYVEGNSRPMFCVDCDDNSHELMQFTGLKDKNGKEIYEGDIVRVDEPQFLRCREIDVIEFRSACFFIGDSDDMSSLHNAQLNGTDKARLEILGNIYENPQLLQ